MLPNLGKLSLVSQPTGEFWTLTPAEAAEEDEEPIHGNPFLPGQARGSLVATFRVRSKDPRPGTTDQYFYNYFEAQSLWDWVKKQGQASNPKTRDPLWKEDWLALHDRFDPDGAVPNWVRNLPQLDPNFADDHTYGAGAVALHQDWANDLRAAFSLSWDFVENEHGGTPVEEAAVGLSQVLRRMMARMEQQVRHNTYRQPLITYDGDVWADAGLPSITDVIDNLLVIVYTDTSPLRAKTACIDFVAQLLRKAGHVPRVANYVYDEDSVDHDRLRSGLDQYISDVANARTIQPLERNLNRIAALRVRHHTFWKKPLLDYRVKGPPRSTAPPPPAHTAEEEAVMAELTQKVGEATEFMNAFTHEQDDVEGFFQLEEYSHYLAKPPVQHASERLSEVEALFLKSARRAPVRWYARRALAVRFFTNVLNVFIELSLWDDADYGLFSAELGEEVRDWAAKVASVLKNVMRTEDTVSFTLEGVKTFFWWYVAPLYETDAAWYRIHAQSGELVATDRDDVMKALDLLHETIRNLPLNPPPTHDRPEGEAAPNRRRQRT